MRFWTCEYLGWDKAIDHWHAYSISSPNGLAVEVDGTRTERFSSDITHQTPEISWNFEGTIQGKSPGKQITRLQAKVTMNPSRRIKTVCEHLNFAFYPQNRSDINGQNILREYPSFFERFWNSLRAPGWVGSPITGWSKWSGHFELILNSIIKLNMS